MPNFLVIGAAKSGTEALCNYLGQHPDVYMCPHREPTFFEAEGRPEVPYRGPGDVAWLAPEMWTSSLAAYEALFADATEAAIGEGRRRTSTRRTRRPGSAATSPTCD